MSVGASGIMALYVQRAIYAKLSQYTPLTDLLATDSDGGPGIFDAGGVPEGQPQPYVTIGMVIESPNNTLNHMGRDLVCTFHVWAQFGMLGGIKGTGEGFADALTIAHKLAECLDNMPLKLETGNVWRCQFDGLHTLLDPDGATHHVPVSFRIGAQF